MVFVVISTKENPPTVWLEEQTPQPSVVCFVSCSLWNSWSTLKEKKGSNNSLSSSQFKRKNRLNEFLLLPSTAMKN